MPVSGNYGTPGNPYGDIWSEFWELQWYSGSDPAHVEGDFWGRSDLSSGDKIGTLRFDNGTSVVDIPVFPAATDPNVTEVKKVSGIQTPNGEAWMPIYEGGGAYSYLGYQHAGARHGVHDGLGSAIPDSGIAYYKFEQNLQDSFGNFDATDNTSAGYVTGAPVGTYAKAYDGVDDYADTGIGDSTIVGLSEVTVCGWVNPDSFNTLDAIVSNTIANNSCITLRTVNGNLQWGVTTDTDGWNDGPEGNPVSTNAWTFVAGVYSDNDNEWRIHQGSNASLVNSGTHSGVIARSGSTSLTVKLGTQGDAGGDWWDGDHDDTRMYPSALTQSQLAEIASLGA